MDGPEMLLHIDEANIGLEITGVLFWLISLKALKFIAHWLQNFIEQYYKNSLIKMSESHETEYSHHLPENNLFGRYGSLCTTIPYQSKEAKWEEARFEIGIPLI